MSCQSNICFHVDLDKCFHSIFKNIMKSEVYKKDDLYIFDSEDFLLKYKHLCKKIEKIKYCDKCQDLITGIRNNTIVAQE